MRKCLLVVVLCFASCAYAQQFQLRGSDGALNGPFKLKDGVSVSVGDTSAVMTNVMLRKDMILDAMSKIRIPEIDFRQANIRDVVDWFHSLSVKGVGEGSGINFAVCLSGEEQAGAVVEEEAPDPFSVSPVAVATEPSSGTIKIDFSAQNITLLEALEVAMEIGQLKYRIRNGVVMILPKNAPDGEIITRIYSVLSTPISRLQESYYRGGERENDESTDLKHFFEGMGVSWPIGSSVKFIRGLGKLFVANTCENLKAFENALYLMNVLPCQIEIEVQFVSFDRVDIAKNCTTGVTMESLTALLESGRGKLLAAPRTITQSGQQATVKGVTEYIYPTEVEAFGIQNRFDATIGAVNSATVTNATVGAVVTPSSFETREVGVILEVMPEVSPEGSMINITLSPELVEPPEWKDYEVQFYGSNGQKQTATLPQPFFQTYQQRTNILIKDGGRILIGGGVPSRDGTSMVYMFLMARKVGIDGSPITRASYRGVSP